MHRFKYDVGYIIIRRRLPVSRRVWYQVIFKVMLMPGAAPSADENTTETFFCISAPGFRRDMFRGKGIHQTQRPTMDVIPADAGIQAPWTMKIVKIWALQLEIR